MDASEADVETAQGQQMEAAARRYECTRGQREEVLEARHRGRVVTDTEDQLSVRAERLVESFGSTPLRTVVQLAVSQVPDRVAAYERIIGEANNLQSASFLARGIRAVASIGRISKVHNGRHLPHGTGFLVSPKLLMTNNHVLPDAETARCVVVEFGAEVDVDHHPTTPVRYHLDPAAFFVTDAHLDVTLVLVSPDDEGRDAGETFGWNPLIRQQGKIVTGERVNVAGHPMGRLKEISIRDNTLDLQLDDFLHYSTDTEPGNSGSPVFNDQWEVVALHHSGVPERDDLGRWLRKDGQVWQPGDGDDAIHWVANEGARVSVLLTWLAGLDLDEQRRRILAGLGPGAEVDLPAAAPAEVTHAALAAVPAPRADVPVVEAGEAAGARGARGSRREPQVVFLHGRSQQGKDPGRLRSQWTAGLNAGLTRSDLPGLDARSAWFPFYGDRLVDVLGAREGLAGAGSLDVDAAEAFAPPAGDPAREVYEEIVAAAATQAGMPAELASAAPEEGLAGLGGSLVSALQKQLGWLAARSGLDDATIALAFRDVAAYLGRPGVRSAVLDAVCETLPTGRPLVLVAHSLGTVVAMDLIEREGLDVSLLVTAGSPLGMDAVHRKLLAPRPARPQRVARWLNAWAAADPVAIGCPLRPHFGDGVQDVVTDNAKDRAHDIAEYLGAPQVARVIGSALTPTGVPVPA